MPCCETSELRAGIEKNSWQTEAPFEQIAVQGSGIGLENLKTGDGFKVESGCQRR